MTGSATFRVRVGVPRFLRLSGKTGSREEFFDWAWVQFGPRGLLGIHEGTLLSEEAASKGFETESWTIDAGEAPRERDWIGAQDLAEAELYFDTREQALDAIQELKKIGEGFVLSPMPIEQPNQDWDAEWKASFRGASVPPFWEIVPPWLAGARGGSPSDRVFLQVNPGAGFGTGTHETTQLCLQALGEHSLKTGRSLAGKEVLDFGSGSGILSIGAALLGARSDAVEIDPLAIDNAIENAELNHVSDHLRFSQTLLESPQNYDVVIANILKPVLLEFADPLIARIKTHGTLILSGLTEPDVRPILERYAAVSAPEVRTLGDWRALWWRSR